MTHLLCRVGWHKDRLFIRTIPIFIPGDWWADVRGFQCLRCLDTHHILEITRRQGYSRVPAEIPGPGEADITVDDDPARLSSGTNS